MPCGALGQPAPPLGAQTPPWASSLVPCPFAHTRPQSPVLSSALAFLGPRSAHRRSLGGGCIPTAPLCAPSSSAPQRDTALPPTWGPIGEPAPGALGIHGDSHCSEMRPLSDPPIGSFIQSRIHSAHRAQPHHARCRGESEEQPSPAETTVISWGLGSPAGWSCSPQRSARHGAQLTEGRGGLCQSLTRLLALGL